jgi:hypothetical protein
MNDDQYFPVPLAHLTSPFVPPAPLESNGEPAPPSRPPAEPLGMLDAEEPPELYGVDEITVLARDPYTLFAHWEITAAGRQAARARLGEDGLLVLRLTASSGPVIDDPLPRDAGHGYVPAPYPGASLVPIVGLRGSGGRFEPIASAPRLRVPWNQPEEGPVEWMEISPTRTRGARREPPVAVRRGVAGDAAPGLGQGLGLWPAPPYPAGRRSSPSVAAPGSRTPTSPGGPGSSWSTAPTSPAGGGRRS